MSHQDPRAEKTLDWRHNDRPGRPRAAVAHDPDYCDAHRPRGWTCNQPHAAEAMRAELPPFSPFTRLALAGLLPAKELGR
jgi:hypothetical protein